MKKSGANGHRGQRVALETLGCKLNQAETETLARELTEAGYEVVTPEDKADVYILNTCTVTHIADRKSRHLLRLAHRRHPKALVVAAGCYAQRAPTELGRIEEVDLVLNNTGKQHLVPFLEEAGYLVPPKRRQTPNTPPTTFRTRAFIKIQKGCATPCSYCIVPLVRGRETSLTPEGAVAEIKERLAGGYKEIVLTGTKVGAYQSGGVSLAGLIRRILEETDIPRLRLSSLQPREISPELVELWRDERLCRHFHLALQSGSEAVLQRMKRGYSRDEYEAAINLIRSQLPDAAVTTDIIVGFPGETDTEFHESLDFCRRMEFARIHVFPFSARRETPAARLPDKVTDKVKKQRSQQMLTLGEESARQFQQRFLGKTLPVLWEQQTDGVWSGLTGNYIKVYCKTDRDLTNKITAMKLVEIVGDGVWGNQTI